MNEDDILEEQIYQEMEVEELSVKILRYEEVLKSIALSYPETDEGETLAGLARDVLKEMQVW